MKQFDESGDKTFKDLSNIYCEKMDVEISNLDNELNKMCAIDVERDEKMTKIIETGINKCIYSINNQIDDINSNDQLNLEGPSDSSDSVEI